MGLTFDGNIIFYIKGEDMIKYCLIFGVLFSAINVNGNSVRLAGMGGIYVAVEDFESEAQENPAKYLNYEQPVVLFDAIRKYIKGDYGFLETEDSNNVCLIPTGRCSYKMNLNGLILYPIKGKVILGGGYTENISNEEDYYYCQPNVQLLGSAYYAQYLNHSYFFTGAFSTAYINIGVLSRHYTGSRQKQKFMHRTQSWTITDSSITDIPVTSEYTIGISSNKIKSISATVDFVSDREELLSGCGWVRYLAHTDFKIHAQKRVCNWLSIGGIVEYKEVKKDYTIIGPSQRPDSNYKCINIPLGFAIYPDSQIIIGMDFICDKIFYKDKELDQVWYVNIGGEKTIGNVALRCGTEIYPGLLKYSFNPSIGIGYHLTNRIHFDLAVHPIGWYLWRLAVQYNFNKQ